MKKQTYIIILMLLCAAFVAEAQVRPPSKFNKNKLSSEIIGDWRFENGTAIVTGGAASDDAAFAQRIANNMNKESVREFNADGTYLRTAVGLDGTSFTRSGTWRIENNDTLIMTETTENFTQTLAQPNVLTWHKVSVSGKTLTAYLPYEQSASKPGKIEVKATFTKTN